MYRIEITHTPSSTFGSDKPEALATPRLLQAFRTRTGRRDRSIYGDIPEVVLHDEYRHATSPATWVAREVADRNLARLTDRGYVARVVEV